MNKLIEKMFENRGYDADYLYKISDPTYDDLKDIDLIVTRLKEIHDAGLPITIFPDYDMDGISSGSCFFAGLAELGFNVSLFIPDASYGYGLSAAIVDDIMKEYPNTAVIITCDNGISAVDAADYCKEIGVELIVTDHHVQNDVVNADIIIDPMRLDEKYTHPRICGAFVVYQVLQHYADVFCTSYVQSQIRMLRVFAGIGTVSDMMPLLYENRQIVTDTVSIMKFCYGDGTPAAVDSIQGHPVFRNAFRGIYHALRVCEDRGVLSGGIGSLTEEFIGFYFSPMFNSAKRMEGDLHRCFGVFFGNDPVSDMNYVCDLNEQRKKIVNEELAKLLETDQPYKPYVYISGANGGLLGLLANKLKDYVDGPVFVLGDRGADCSECRYHGSGRAPEWYPILNPETGRLYGKYDVAGHDGAFGIGIKDEDMLNEFVRFLSVDVPQAYDEAEIVEAVPDFIISTDWTKDTGIDISLFDDYLNEIELYRPFGIGFPAPCAQFDFTGKDIVSVRTMGAGDKHLKVSFDYGFELICWNQGDKINYFKQPFDDNPNIQYTAMGDLGRSEFRGIQSINFFGNLMPVAEGGC